MEYVHIDHMLPHLPADFPAGGPYRTECTSEIVAISQHHLCCNDCATYWQAATQLAGSRALGHLIGLSVLSGHVFADVQLLVYTWFTPAALQVRNLERTSDELKRALETEHSTRMGLEYLMDTHQLRRWARNCH